MLAVAGDSGAVQFKGDFLKREKGRWGEERGKGGIKEMSFEIGSDAFIKENMGTSSVLPITKELPGMRQELLQP